MYNPVVSFSIESITLGSSSFMFGSSTSAIVLFSAPCMSNNESCPVSRFFLFVASLSIARSYMAMSCARFAPVEIKQPAFMSDSAMRLFTPAHLLAKSKKSVKCPFLRLSSIISFMAFSPTFLIAASPNLIAPFSTVNLAKLSLISGGSTFMPICFAQNMYWLVLSALPRKLFMSAAINSTG